MNKRHYEHTLPNIRGSLSNTYKWKRLALTKKKKLRIRIPQRQFLGESRELSEKIDQKMENEIRNILNL